MNKINLQHIENIICIMRNLSNNSRKLTINIWNTNYKKELPHQCSKIKPENINSGSTLPGEFINLWRQEELYKVLIHELIHTFFLDFRDNDNLIYNYIRNNYNITTESPVYIWESYTEFLAIIIHSIYMSKTFQQAINLISIEKYFNYLQCAKFLNHFKCGSVNDLENKHCILSYKTDVFSYFFIKTALLHSLDESVNFMINNNTNLINFEQDTLPIFLNLITKITNNSKFINNINKYIQLLYDIKDNILKKTFRMSIIELK